jgi:hypothetical protein
VTAKNIVLFNPKIIDMEVLTSQKHLSAVDELQKIILQEEKKYLEALKSDSPFFVLKKIRSRIKSLRLEQGSNTNDGGKQ